MSTDEKPKLDWVAGDPVAANGHRLRTRRDFLSAGAIPFLGYVMTPSVFSLLRSGQAQASGCTPAVTQLNGARLPVFSIEAAGGAGLAGSVVAMGQDNQFLPDESYIKLSWDTALAPSRVGVDTTYGLPMYAGNGNGFLAGLNSVTTEAVRNLVNGIALPNVSMDDSNGNAKCALSALARLSDLSYLLVHTVGNSDTANGTRSQSPVGGLPASIKSSLIRTPNDAISLVTPGNLFNLLGAEKVEKILNSTRNLSARALTELKSKGVEEQIAETMKCAYSDALGQLTRFGANDVSPVNDTRLNTVFNFNDGTQSTIGTIAKLVLDGLAACGKMTFGGYDYHGSDAATTRGRDFTLGTNVGRIFQAAFNCGQPVAIYIHSDGSVVASGQGTPNADGRFPWVGDRGNLGMDVFMVMGKPGTSRPTLTSPGHSIGWFNPAPGVATSSSRIANSPTNAAYCVLYNYLALLGREGDLKQALGGAADPFVGSDAAMYKKFNRIET